MALIILAGLLNLTHGRRSNTSLAQPLLSVSTIDRLSNISTPNLNKVNIAGQRPLPGSI